MLQSFVVTEQTAMELDPRVLNVYDRVKDRIEWKNLVPVCIFAVGEIEQYKELRGPQKLELLQTVLRHAVKQLDKDPLEKEEILHSIESIVPVIAQTAVHVEKHVQAIVTSCWAICRKI